MSSVKETIQAGSFKEFFEPGDFFRLLETTGPVNVEFYYMGRETVDVQGIEAGYAEYFRDEGQTPFDRVRIYSATTQTVKFVTRNGSDVRYDRGASTVGGSVDLNAATLAALNRPETSNGNFNANTALAALAVETIFTPGANLNGAKILSAGFTGWANGLVPGIVLIAKNGAPTSNVDGEVILSNMGPISTVATNYCESAQLAKEQFIPAGLGLYLISTNGVSAGHLRHCRYRLY